MEQAGFPVEDDVAKDSGKVFYFPQASPDGAVCTKEVGALDQLRLWKIYQDHWCEHKPSITVFYREHEFFAICQWMWENFDILSGISLLPLDGGVYAQPPYAESDKETFEVMSAAMPEFNWEELAKFEEDDMTTGSQELACVGASCEIS